MSPVVVRTFSAGPPPFKLPSAVTVFGPQSPPSVVTRISEKSEWMRWPLARLDGRANRDVQVRRQIDRDVPGGSFQHRIVALIRRRRRTWPRCHRPRSQPARTARRSASMLPPPVSALHRLHSRKPAGCCRRRFQFRPDRRCRPDRYCRPPVVAFTFPPQRSTSMLPPPVSSTAPCSPETTITLPPPLSALILPLAEPTLMVPPPVCRLSSAAHRSYLDAAAAGFGVDAPPISSR